MKIVRLRGNPSQYCCNSYLVLGSWNRLEDVNTLVDPGTDAWVLHEISQIHTGVGKRGVEQVVITHNHFDHAGGIVPVVKRYNPRVFAFTRYERVDTMSLLEDGQVLRFGDRDFEAIKTPGHSNDSVCYYCAEDGVLFSGDTPVRVMTPGGSYSRDFLHALEHLASLDIRVIYSGHDDPVERGALGMLQRTLVNVRKSHIVD